MDLVLQYRLGYVGRDQSVNNNIDSLVNYIALNVYNVTVCKQASTVRNETVVIQCKSINKPRLCAMKQFINNRLCTVQ